MTIHDDVAADADTTIVENPLQYCFSVILKEARKEERLVKQIVYTMFSAYTNDPCNLAINSPSGEGKTYALTKVGDLFPKEDILFLSGMTEKALFHRNGIFVLKNEVGEYVSIDDKLMQIEEEILDKEADIESSHDRNFKEGRKNEIKELIRQKKDLMKDAKLIDLSHKILVFLDTPPWGLFAAMMSLLSHDKYEVEYEFVDTNNGIKTHTNVLRGYPAVIFAQAIDYSHYPRWAEEQRRFIITNPKMTQEKYEQAIDLIGDKYGLPDFAYQELIVKDDEKQKARDIVRDIREKILNICNISRATDSNKNNVLIPFSNALKRSLPKEKAFDMTTANRFFGFLVLLPIINIDRRPAIVIRKKGNPVSQTIPFALFEDLEEARFLMEHADGVRPYIFEWFYDVFLKSYEEKEEPDSKRVTKGKEDITITESRIALTTENLVEKTFCINKKVYTKKQILENYVYPLVNQGYIGTTESQLDRRAKIYYPIIITTISKNRNLFDRPISNNFSHKCKITITDPSLFPSRNYIISKIQQILKYSETPDVLVKICDHENQETTIKDLVDEYYNSPENYFVFSEVVSGSNHEIKINENRNQHDARFA